MSPLPLHPYKNVDKNEDTLILFYSCVQTVIDVGGKIGQIAVGENVCGTSLSIGKIGTKNQGTIL